MTKHIVKCKECDFEKEAYDYQEAEHIELDHIDDKAHDGVYIEWHIYNKILCAMYVKLSASRRVVNYWLVKMFIL